MLPGELTKLYVAFGAIKTTYLFDTGNFTVRIQGRVAMSGSCHPVVSAVEVCTYLQNIVPVVIVRQVQVTGADLFLEITNQCKLYNNRAVTEKSS